MMRRIGLTILAAALAAQPALADGLSSKARRELAARNGGVADQDYDPATAGRFFQIAPRPSNLPPGQVASRIKDIAQLQSARDNQLVGYGLVIGLQGTGDSLRNAPFTEQSIRAMLENLGIATEDGRARAKNVAAVIVTANMPAFVQSGARIDIDVSSMGDATSLQGGTLIMTPLKAANGEIYAVGQGPVLVSGFTAKGQAEQVTQGVPTAGRIPNGAIVERSVQAEFGDENALTLQLRNPDFSTAVRIADAINDYTSRRFGARVAAERDARTVSIRKPKGVSTARFYAEIENLMIESDTPAKVVVDERSGTIVIGSQVRISRVAISHGTLTVRITEAPRVVQPEPFSRGETAVEPFTAIEASRPDARVAVLDGPDLETLVSGLNRLGVKPDGIIAILQGIKSAGALQADLVLQ